MATAVDFWNEVDRRIDARISGISGMAGTESADGTSAPPPAAGGLPIHNNAHHEPPLALQSDLESLTFLDLLDTPETYAGASLFLLRVNAGMAAVEFADGSLLYDSIGTAAEAVADHVAELDPHTQYYNETRGDARYALIGHLQAVTAGGTGLTAIAADQIIYGNGVNTYGTTALTAFARDLLDDVNAAAMRTTLELVAGALGDIWVEKAGDTMTGTLVAPAIEVATSVGSNPIVDFRDGDFSGNAFGTLFSPAIADNTIGRISPFGVGGFAFNGFAAGTTTVPPLTFAGYSTTTGTTTVPAVLIVGWKSNGTNLRQAIAGSEILLQLQAGLSTSYSTVLAPLTVLAGGDVGLGTPTPGAQLDVMRTTGGVVRISRNDTSIVANDVLGKIEFYGNDTDLSTQNIFGNIEVQAQAAIASDAAFSKMLFRTTGPGTATTPVERLGLGLVKTLTDAATNLFEVTLGAGQMAGGTVIWTIIASNGTDHQAYSGIATYAVVNKAGAYTTQITHNTGNDSKAVSSGTLTATWSVLNGANKVTIRVTPTGSLTETTYQILYSVHSNSPQSITVL